MKLRAALLLALAFTFAAPTAATAHQPVALLDADTTAARGPLLVDGTISFAVNASFTRNNQVKAFRAAFKEGDDLSVQYLIFDRKPENKLKNAALPVLTITAPNGIRTTIKFTERTKFYEPWGKKNYLYLSRYTAAAQAGIYNFTITSKGRATVTIAVGEKEIEGEVLRGPAPSATPTASATPTPTPTPTATTAGYTAAQVAANNTSASCWSIISNNVYDLTKWITSHPGGASAITSLCGRDGTDSFYSQHRSSSSPLRTLASYLLGPLSK
jgi:cytochrome b involved in lipid metabolism